MIKTLNQNKQGLTASTYKKNNNLTLTLTTGVLTLTLTVTLTIPSSYPAFLVRVLMMRRHPRHGDDVRSLL